MGVDSKEGTGVRSAIGLVVSFVVALTLGHVPPADESIPFDRLAGRIVSALKVEKGERVLLRFDPATMAPLEPALRARLVASGATVETLNYGAAPDLETRLKATDIYIWMPAG